MLKAIYEKQDEIPEEYKSLYSEKNGKWELTGIQGVYTQGNIDRLQTALNNEREEHKATKKKYSAIADRDIDEVVAQLDRIPELEAAAKGKIDEKQLDDLAEARVRSRIAPLERELKTLREKNTEHEGVINEFKQKDRKRTISDAVLEAINGAEGFVKSASEDVLLYAERTFDVLEDGKVVTKDGVGVTPGLDPKVWLSDMQAKKPHWWGETSGSGSGGKRRPGTAGSNPFAKDSWNLTEQGKLLVTNRPLAEQYAKAAGVTIGGSPVAKT